VLLDQGFLNAPSTTALAGLAVAVTVQIGVALAQELLSLLPAQVLAVVPASSATSSLASR